MDMVHLIAGILALTATAAASVIAVRAVMHMIRILRLGAPDRTRKDSPGQRWLTLLRESLGHTRMLQWKFIGVAHWFVFIAFGALLFTLIAAYGEVFDPEFSLPVLDGWAPYGLFIEIVAATCGISIAALMIVRQRNNPQKVDIKSRFAGSTTWQAYFVEWVIVGIVACVFLIRGFQVSTGHFDYAAAITPVSHGVGAILPAWSTAISVVAAFKIAISMAWFIVIALNLTMGIAWHRFTAFFNIWFKRRADGAVALGALQPLRSDGEILDFETADPEKESFGADQVERFTWKGLLDFTTCTECGRCQSQCPAWNTAKPLSPKLLIMSLRDHAYAKAPYLLAGGGKTPMGEEKGDPAKLATLSHDVLLEAERPLVGDVNAGGVIDPEVLWSCTTCGACVEQCPVDIEHVDHIMDMRRYQTMIETAFPPEAGAMLRNLETKGNPWGENPASRMDWAKDLPFTVQVIEPGEPLPEQAEYLYWVGCAGAFDAKARKTARAVAELLHAADVSFAVLGAQETCTGDPARRMGHEFLFTTLAQQNINTLGTTFAKRIDKLRRKIVVTCPHCLNTLGNEYPQLGGDYDVVHHSELLARLVNEKRLVPNKPLGKNLTYHDPCYLGRHNRVFHAPRELINALPGTAFAEMPRNQEKSFCCGAGGGRMWMEEKTGKRINTERTEEAMSLEPDVVVTACPFCTTMLSDGVSAKQSDGDVPEHVEVVDLAQLLSRSMK